MPMLLHGGEDYECTWHLMKSEKGAIRAISVLSVEAGYLPTQTKTRLEWATQP